MKRLFLAMAALAAASDGFAADSIPVGAAPIAYYNDSGKIVEQKDFPKSPKGATKQVLKSGGITFNVTYNDASGSGWNDTTNGATRKATLAAVLTYLNSVLNETGSCDVVCEASTFTGSGPLASASTLYPAANGFFTGAAFTHIHTGTDPFPGAGNEDIFINVDWGYNWNSGLGAPGGTQVDLYSVMLHEITHGLGIGTLSDSSGASVFFSGFSTTTYTGFDELLYTTGGVKLWNSSQTFSGSSLVGGDNTLQFRGPLAQTALSGTFPPIYAPGPFEPGSSLAHWQDPAPIPGAAVMHYSLGPGVQRRAYQAFEKAALADLGYNVSGSSVPEWMSY